MENLIAACGHTEEDDTDTVAASTTANGFGTTTPLEGLTPRRPGGLAGLLLAGGRAESTPNRSSRSLFGGGESVREEARPSPERLDAQLRSLTNSQVRSCLNRTVIGRTQFNWWVIGVPSF